MLSVGWLIAAVLVAIVLTLWVSFTLTRLDRLHARVDAAQAALDSQLVRRAAALQHVAEMPGSRLPRQQADQLAEVAQHALAPDQRDRPAAENRLGRALRELAGSVALLPAAAVEELSESATRVVIARRFYNDAVRDTRTLRARRMPRMLHLAGYRELPQYFDIDDSSPFDGPTEGEPDPFPLPVTARPEDRTVEEE
ncbi:hypothetical protein M6D93_10890 [Jatrophihabitans telluris]|uniref:LemA family protein n=1 Tax=Jatrophihabitans telluris TaxID=2038343 RepID=A0ABY4QTL6_9ACTN|nr:hypothetical protein [Jatrophihabitans telluris]UQX86813.1 hypothetical protein M6D93_10890 [Jatrophihabitans telluris]